MFNDKFIVDYEETPPHGVVVPARSVFYMAKRIKLLASQLSEFSKEGQPESSAYRLCSEWINAILKDYEIYGCCKENEE